MLVIVCLDLGSSYIHNNFLSCTLTIMCFKIYIKVPQNGKSKILTLPFLLSAASAYPLPMWPTAIHIPDINNSNHSQCSKCVAQGCLFVCLFFWDPYISFASLIPSGLNFVEEVNSWYMLIVMKLTSSFLKGVLQTFLMIFDMQKCFPKWTCKFTNL